MENTEHKVALVTGGTPGIGESIPLELAANNVEVIVSGRNKEKGEGLINRITQNGGHATFYTCDFSIENGVDDFFKKVNENHSHMDYAINLLLYKLLL